MNNSVINEEIVLKYPDGFGLMDSEELKKYFGTSHNMSGIRNAEQHIIMSFAWNRLNILASVLADDKSVLNGMEKKLKGNLKEYKRTSDISINVCGVKANGFNFEYTSNDGDIAQTGKIIIFKLGKCLYIVQFAARKEQEQQAQNVFDEIITSMTIGKN